MGLADADADSLAVGLGESDGDGLAGSALTFNALLKSSETVNSG